MYKNPAVIFLIIAVLVSYKTILYVIDYGTHFDKYNFMEYVLAFKEALWYLYVPSIVLFLIKLFSHISKNKIYQRIIYIVNGLTISISIMYIAILTLFLYVGLHLFD